MKMKDTLQMPKTDFAMKASLTHKEPLLQKQWVEQDIYNKIIEKNANNKPFLLLDGPPYANGELHMGHALNKILKDFIFRYKNMTGYKAEVIYGWDTHGLPIENALLKNKKIKRNELTDAEFRTKCEEYAKVQVENQKKQFYSLGILTGQENEYKTLDKDYEAEQIRVFNKMVSKGLIYKGLKPVYWSPSSQSALADAEIEYQDKVSCAIYVAINILDSKFENTSIVIWTTTPWTLPANNGVSVNPEFTYLHIQTSKGKFIVAKKLVESFIKECEIESYEIISEFLGSELENINIKHPIYDKNEIIMLGEHVTDESGTGCVHTAGGHGEDDFIVSKKYNIEIVSYVDSFGKMTANALQYEGIFYDDINKLITEKLDEESRLLNMKFIKHSYPHDWRTKKPVIYRATFQWFASIKPVKDSILSELDKVNFINDWGHVRLSNMIQGRDEWCISRQRKWGVPIPIFYTQNEEPIIDENLIEHVAKLFETHGSNIWFEKTAAELLPEGYTHVDSPDNVFTKENDIMDVWFDSGSAHSAVGKKRLNMYPADLYLEGSDQYRGWFNSSLITGVIQNDTAPFKNLLSHGFVLDAKGNKMSKSLGNTMLPSKVTNTLGADIIRLWVASVDYQSDVRVSQEILNQVSEIYRRYRNTIRFMLGNIGDLDTSKIIEVSKLEKFDKYMMIKLDQLIINVTSSYESFDFKKVIDYVNNYITIELSAFYLDYIKDITYITLPDDERRIAIQSVLHYHVEALLKLLSPILVHTCFEGYNSFNNKNVFLEDFITPFNIKDDNLVESAIEFLNLRKKINREIEDLRDKKIIGKSFEAQVSIKNTPEVEKLSKIFGEFDLYLIVSNVVFDENQEEEIKVSKFEQNECNRCRKYFNEVNKINLDDGDYEVCESCLNIINLCQE